MHVEQINDCIRFSSLCAVVLFLVFFSLAFRRDKEWYELRDAVVRRLEHSCLVLFSILDAIAFDGSVFSKSLLMHRRIFYSFLVLLAAVTHAASGDDDGGELCSRVLRKFAL